MANEETNQQTEPTTVPDSTVVAASAASPAPVTEDWQKRYTDLQAEHTRVSQEAARNKELLDMVDWNKLNVQNQTQPAINNDELVTRQQLMESVGETKKNIDAQLGVLYFRQKYPDLVAYEEKLIGPMVGYLGRKYGGRKSPEAIMDEAAKEAKSFLEDERRKATEDANKVRQSAASAGGLGSTVVQTPKPESPKTGAESYADYIKSKRELQKKKTGS